ncbi:hypothetical protein CYY_002844 [Polysphondylium violaceum]|uniref:LIM-type zinc finger-containing protein n=1 Tax=Polysphondylium violaceum TaxID=133409 RepID=A0A8J4PVP2_9MYCE|nr:hypothetical protein CYY_002844 [Polysphondylium violaceum]
MSDVAPPPPPPPAPAPPPPPPVSAKPASAGRSALLGSIEGFNSSKLKKVSTNEKKPPLEPAKSSGSSSSGPSGGSRPAGAGPSGFGDIFAGGMPKLRSTKGNETGNSSAPAAPAPTTSAPVKTVTANTTTTPGSKPGYVTSVSKPVIKQSTGVLRPAPVISKAPILSKPAPKPAPGANNNAPAPAASNPVAKPAAVPTPTPLPPSATSTSAGSSGTATSSPKPNMDIPPPIAKPTTTTTPQEPVNATHTEHKNEVVSEHTITPSGNPPAPAAPVTTKAPSSTTTTTTTTHTSTTSVSAAPKVTTKPGSQAPNWVSPAAGPVNPIGRVVQSVSVQSAPPRVTSTATALKQAPTIKSPAKPAPVVSKPASPTATSSPKPNMDIPPPIAKPTTPTSSTPHVAASTNPHNIHKVPAPKEEKETPHVAASTNPHNIHKVSAPPASTPTPAPKEEKEIPHVAASTNPHNIHKVHPPAPAAKEEETTTTTTITNKTPAAKPTTPRNDSDDLLCARCHGVIEGNHFKALEQAWHIDHFTCVECNNAIQNFVAHEGQPYCELCFDRKFVVHKICHMCDKPIHGTVVTAMNNTFHTECFKCNSCHTSFPDNEFFQYEGKPWCAKCITNQVKTKYETCDYCNNSIDSKSEGVIKVLGSKYHNNNSCFRCYDCKSPFPNLNYYEVNNHPLCYDCAIKH